MFEKTKVFLKYYFPFLIYLVDNGEPIRSLILIIGIIGCKNLINADEHIYGFLLFNATILLSYIWKKRYVFLNARRVLYSLLRQQNAKLMSTLTLDKQEARHILPGQDMFRSTWLRNILQKIWPTFLSNLIQDEMNKVYSTSKGNVYTTKLRKQIQFESFVINKDYAPSVSDLTVTEDAHRTDEIVISAYIKFHGNIKFRLKTLRTPLMLRDVHFREEARIVLRPLQSRSPFVGGFAFWLCDKPVMDYSFRSEIKQLFQDDEDFELFQQFLVHKVSNSFVTPNKIYIKFGDYDSIESSQKIMFPVPLAVAFLQVIEAQNLTRVSRDFSPFCCLRIGTHRQRGVCKTKHHSPLFDEFFWATIHDFYEQCEIEIFNSTLRGDLFIGSVKFTLKDKAFSVRRQETGTKTATTDINGVDFWLPLEKSQGMLHIKLTVFKLVSSESIINHTFKQMQGLELDKYRFPIAVVSVFVKNLKLERLKKGKDKNQHKLEIVYEKRRKETLGILGVDGLYVWDEGFNFFLETSPFEGKKELIFTLYEFIEKATGIGKSHRPLASGKLQFFHIFEKCKKDKTDFTYKNWISLYRVDSIMESSTVAKVQVVIVTRFVSTDRALLEKLCSPPEIKAVDVEHKTINACQSCIEYMKDIVFEHGEEIDVIKQDAIEDFDDKDVNACRVKLQFRLNNRHTLAVDVIRVINIPVFNEGEVPESQVVIELWRSNLKLTQQNTNFKPRTRDPIYGRRFKFLINDGNIQRHLIRVVVASKSGWIRKRITLVAEAFCGIPKLEIEGSAVISWFKLSPIGFQLTVRRQRNG